VQTKHGLSLHVLPHHVLDLLPAAVYTTDAEGRITYFNEAAAKLWGVRPVLGESEFCGSWKLYWPDGSPLPHAECPMAQAMKERRPLHGIPAVAERPDGIRVPFQAYPAPFFDASGALAGAVNMLVETAERAQAEHDTYRLAAIIESSHDAIVTKDLNGVIMSWNRGAEALFGYSADEAIGRPVTILIPEGRHDEEPEILARIRRGESIDHYDTVRQCKDGTLVDISLTVSPIRNAAGVVIGASKIARDITERRRAREQNELLLREMNHRIKNLFALSASVVTLSTSTARTPEELAEAVGARLGALARAHTLTLSNVAIQDGKRTDDTTLHALVRTIVLPYEDSADGREPRVAVGGDDLPIAGNTVTSFALLLHEFATNAAKYGALSNRAGQIAFACRVDDTNLTLTWTERGGPPVRRTDDADGFGTWLADTTVRGQFEGEIERDWRTEGMVIRLSIPRCNLEPFTVS
jgi:PAS domain S-box-containing protein